MIRFDNGPPDGDYVRYIDELMAQRAAALKLHASVTPSSSMHASRRASTPWSTGTPASATMTPHNPRYAASFLDAIAIAVGTVLILVGILGATSNVLFIVAGIALVSWAIKRLGRSAARPVAATTVDAGTIAPMQRAPSRIKNKV